MKRQKQTITPALKADDFDTDSVVIATGYIREVKEVTTQFNEEGQTSTVINIEDDAEKDKSKALKGVFANIQSKNNCIDAFGDDDSNWVGKAVRVICNKDNPYKKKQLVIQAIK